MEFVADDLDVGSFLPKQSYGVICYHLAERVVLADDVDAAEFVVHRNKISEHVEFHDRMGVETEMPEAALFVCQNGIDRGIVNLQNLLACIAPIMLRDSLV